MPVFQILNGEREGVEIVFDDHDEVFIGKGDTCIVKIGDAGVSRKHARLTRGADGWIVEDLGSANGTYVNFKKRSQNEPTELNDKDIIFIGRTVAKFWISKPQGGDGAVSRTQLRDLLRATVPIKGLACPSCRTDLERDLAARVKEQEQLEVARRLRLHELDPGSLDRLMAQARR